MAFEVRTTALRHSFQKTKLQTQITSEGFEVWILFQTGALCGCDVWSLCWLYSHFPTQTRRQCLRPCCSSLITIFTFLCIFTFAPLSSLPIIFFHLFYPLLFLYSIFYPFIHVALISFFNTGHPFSLLLM